MAFFVAYVNLRREFGLVSNTLYWNDTFAHRNYTDSMRVENMGRVERMDGKS